MNKYEERAERARGSSMRFSKTMWTLGGALIVIILLILGLNGSGSPQFRTRTGLGIAVFLLAARQVIRRLKTKTPRAAQPDPRSRLNLQ